MLGCALAQPLSRLLVASLNTSQYSIHLSITTDWRVLLFAAVVAVLTCVVFGTIPAMRGTGVDPIASLKSGERGIAGGRERFSVQRLMVVTQIAVSLVLLVGALLFVRSYRNLMTLDPGMRESGITVGYFGYSTMNIKPENEAGIQAATCGGCAQRARGGECGGNDQCTVERGHLEPRGACGWSRKARVDLPTRARATLRRWGFRS